MKEQEELLRTWASVDCEDFQGPRQWFHEVLANKTIKSLSKNRMRGFYVPSRGEALSLVMSLIPKGANVSFGDSVTLYEVGLVEALRQGDYNLIDPWEKGLSMEESLQRRRRAFLCDIFFSGTNSITLDGKLVNIDGLGNRVAALIFGPFQVVIVAGINKIAKDVEAALQRIKTVACPLNAKRHNYQSPCATTGVCGECRGRWRICNKTVIIEGESVRFFPEPRTSVVIVGEELGF